ncbi:MAG: hypothetical protein GY855_08835 [candidate division Zixibacteria bacterium]|nr:hypothetical protein [candidate division Zixibacteria bacterium]
MTYVREAWSFPAHDNFDGYLVDNIYSQSAIVYPDFGFSAAYKPHTSKYAPGIGLSYHPLRDYRYNYEEEVREASGYAQPDERDSLISINRVRNTGRYYFIGLGAGWSLNKYLSFGLAYNYFPSVVGAERNFESDVIYPDTTQTDTGERQKITPESSGFLLVGFNVMPNDRYNFGFTYQTEYTAKSKYDCFNYPLSMYQEGKYEEVNPVSLGAAFSFHPRSTLLSYLEVEFHYTYWSNYRVRDRGTLTTYGADTTSAAIDTSYYDNLEDSWEVRVGVEHQFYSKVPVRFGFRMFPNPENRRIMSNSVSCGTGFLLNKVQLDLAFQLTTRTSRQQSWFGNANRWDAEINSLKESHLSGTVSMLYKFDI